MGWTTFQIQENNITPRIDVDEIENIGKAYTKYCRPHMKFETQASVLYNRQEDGAGWYKNRCLQFVKECHELDLLVQKIVKGESWDIKPKAEEGFLSGDTYVVTQEVVEGVHTTSPSGMTELLNKSWEITVRDYFEVIPDPVFDIDNPLQLKTAHDFAVNRIIRVFNPDNNTNDLKLQEPTQEDFNFYIKNI